MAKSDTAEQAPEGVLDETGEGFVWDMTNTEASSYPVLPKATYDAVIDSVEYKLSKSSGNPMWAVRHLITGGGSEVAAMKLLVNSFVVFKADAMDRARTFLDRVAPDLVTSSFNPKEIAESGVLIGRPHRVRLDIRQSEEYGASNEVKGVLPPSAAPADGGFAM